MSMYSYIYICQFLFYSLYTQLVYEKPGQKTGLILRLSFIAGTHEPERSA